MVSHDFKAHSINSKLTINTLLSTISEHAHQLLWAYNVWALILMHSILTRL